ncbi:MAG: hypothetical protein PHP44_02110 [Kiritimatiellae bacterium]|nr:hypothetical protein [Kiritimatiellia bacterium]MDD4734882.1 hypothetical protein [Kiritimatiellia bacterium]
MRRMICWKERLSGGVKREVRVTFLPGEHLKWQYKRSDEERWDYDTPPTKADWDILLEKTQGFYNRRRATLKQLEAVQRLTRLEPES